jgi:diguanylate cyclase (GGDEF)-like protein
MPIGGRIAADALRRSEVARHEAASDRRQAFQDRRAAASERHQAERDRDTAWADRDAGADERELSRLDRGIASRDRVVGAGGRVHAERDRSTASADREASAEERDSASVDGLTGVYNRAAGLLELEREMARVRRTQQPFVLAFLDVDQLKAVNDSQGHAAGDQVLVEVAETVKAQARPYDLIIRYGGDEFLCAFSGLQATDVTSRLALVNATWQKPPATHRSPLASRPCDETTLPTSSSHGRTLLSIARACRPLLSRRARRIGRLSRQRRPRTGEPGGGRYRDVQPRP